MDIPSFGPWGFVLASERAIDPASWAIDVPTRFLNAEVLPAMFILPKDFQGQTVEVNRLARPIIVQYQLISVGNYIKSRVGIALLFF